MIIKAVSVIFFLSPVIFAGTYTNDQAVSLVNAAGIHISSSGGCSDQNNPSCTSLNGIHSECIDGPHGIIAFKSASSCDPITITGGTEVGHASGMCTVLKICYVNYSAVMFRHLQSWKRLETWHQNDWLHDNLHTAKFPPKRWHSLARHCWIYLLLWRQPLGYHVS